MRAGTPQRRLSQKSANTAEGTNACWRSDTPRSAPERRGDVAARRPYLRRRKNASPAWREMLTMMSVEFVRCGSCTGVHVGAPALADKFAVISSTNPVAGNGHFTIMARSVGITDNRGASDVGTVAMIPQYPPASEKLDPVAVPATGCPAVALIE